MDMEGYMRQEKRISNKRLRAKLMAIDPHCHWCHCKLIDNSPDFYRKSHPRGYRPPDNVATIEHLYDRFSREERYRDTGNKYKVLACYKCNTARGKIRVLKIGKDAIKKRIDALVERKKAGINVPRPIYLAQKGLV